MLKLTPGFVLFVCLLIASIAFSDLLSRIEEHEGRCSDLRLKQSEMAISLRLVPLISRLDEVLNFPKSEIEKSRVESGKLKQELKTTQRDLELVCDDVASLKRITAFVQAILTALLAIVGLFAGLWFGSKQDMQPTHRVRKPSSKKSGKQS